jgi:hypothetical protein
MDDLLHLIKTFGKFAKNFRARDGGIKLLDLELVFLVRVLSATAFDAAPQARVSDAVPVHS